MSIYARIRKKFGSFVLDAEFGTEGGVLGLLGASGCGKSLALKCVAGVIRPDEGLIISRGVTLFDSEKGINLPPQKRKVGLLFQNYALFPNMTVRENIMTALAHRDKGKMSARFKNVTEKFRIEGVDNLYPYQLSGGQQQRVALARIMASEPSLIMLDEPLSALDSYLRWQIEDELVIALEEFSESGGSTIYVSHDRGEIYRICGKVCVMSEGKNEHVRSTDELFASPDTMASSRLSGCKNYSRAERAGEKTVHALDWGVTLRCGAAIIDDIKFVGVRAHYISVNINEHETPGGEINAGAENMENIINCRVLRVTEDVFSTSVLLSPNGSPAADEYSRIRMELPKDIAAGIKRGASLQVAIKPENVMLLRG